MTNEDRLKFDEYTADMEDNILAKTRNVALDVVATSHAIKSYTSGEKQWNCSCYACQYARSDRRVMDAICRNIVKSYPSPEKG